MTQILAVIHWDWRLTLASVLVLVLLDVRLRRGYDLIVLDVLGNVVLCAIGALLALDASMVKDSWNHTLSARAGSEQAKHQPYFAWVAPAIDLFFGAGHCDRQYRRERATGSVWKAFSAEGAR